MSAQETAYFKTVKEKAASYVQEGDEPGTLEEYERSITTDDFNEAAENMKILLEDADAAVAQVRREGRELLRVCGCGTISNDRMMDVQIVNDIIESARNLRPDVVKRAQPNINLYKEAHGKWCAICTDLAAWKEKLKLVQGCMKTFDDKK